MLSQSLITFISYLFYIIFSFSYLPGVAVSIILEITK